MIETDRWTRIQARWYTPFPTGQRRAVRVIVVHAMEYTERVDAAEIIARDFASRSADAKASAHVCIDNNSIIQCVSDNDVAYAAPGCNNDGIQIELAGYINQTREQWLDDYGRALLANGANVIAQYALKYSLPLVHLTNAELREGGRGIVGHSQVSEVYRKSTHTDPGPGFPWDTVLEMAQDYYDERKNGHPT